MMAPRVFIPAATFVIGFVLLAALLPDRISDGINWLQDGIIDSLGWYYVVIVAAFVVFSLVVAISRFGNIKLGRDDEPAEFKLTSWFAMLFSAGMGIGLVFWGVAEPLWHVASPRPGGAGSGEQAASAAAAQDAAEQAGYEFDADGAVVGPTDPAGENIVDPATGEPVGEAGAAAPDAGYQWFTEAGNESAATEASTEAFSTTFLHWGIHAWGIYVVVGLAIAYAVFRKGRPVSIRWALEPVLGKYARGWLGDIIDIVAIVGTLFGVATSLGLGALQIGAGMEFLNWVEDPGDLVSVLLISAITLVAVFSVVTGIKRGIKWLSNINVSVAGLLLLFVLIAGPTLFLLRGFIQNTGTFVQNLPALSFDVSADQGESGQAWQSLWTTFYWGWWISWAPFVGIFIARISRGRTVREFVVGVLAVPTLVSFLWFSVLGGTAINQMLNGGLADALNPGVPLGQVSDAVQGPSEAGSLFVMLEGLPVAGWVVTVVSAMAILLIATFFITSSDSGSFVVDMLASGGDPDPPTWSRVFWALLEGLVAIALLTMISGTDGLFALRVAAIIAALPFSVVMIAMCVSIWKDFQQEREEWDRAERARHTREVTDTVTQNMIDEGLIEPNGGDKVPAGAGASAGGGGSAGGKAGGKAGAGGKAKPAAGKRADSVVEAESGD